MNVRIHRSEPCGTVTVPTSKSYTIRAALCASMAGGRTVIGKPLDSDDTRAALACLQALGAGVDRREATVAIDGGSLHAPSSPLWCNESAATMRFLMAVAAGLPGTTVLRCAPSLARRPMGPLCDALRRLGAQCGLNDADGSVTVRGIRPVATEVALRGDVSSQYVSALLMSAPLYPHGLKVGLETPLVSRRYVEMTLACMSAFGIEAEAAPDGGSFLVPEGDYVPTRYNVEGDWSAAAPLLALGAATGSVGVLGVSPSSVQADVMMLDILDMCGASVDSRDDGIVVARSAIRAFDCDISAAIDLLPVAMTLGALAPGVSTVRGIARARDKESDRVAAMADGLRRMGVDVAVHADRVVIRGGAARGAVVSSYGDHRIAMALGVAGAIVGGTTILGAECVGKTYPAFWDALRCLGIRIESDE